MMNQMKFIFFALVLHQFFQWINFTTASDPLAETTPEPSPPVAVASPPSALPTRDLTKIKLCHRPPFYSEKKCGRPGSISPIAEISKSIELEASKMPFGLDQWIHLDIVPRKGTSKILKFTHAMVQFSDSQDRIIGRFAEYIACKREGPHGSTYGGELAELYKNPGPKGMQFVECPISSNLSYNANPTVISLTFDPPVEAFYVNIKFTREEMEYLHDHNTDERVSITIILVDTASACHLYRLDKLNGLPEQKINASHIDVPVLCDSGFPAFETDSKVTSPLVMSSMDKLHFSDVRFVDASQTRARPKSRIPRISKISWQQHIDAYNLRQHSIDANGQLPGFQGIKPLKPSTKRRPDLPIIYLPNDIEEIVRKDRIAPVNFDDDDEECDDKLRIKIPQNLKDEINLMYFNCDYTTGCVGEPYGCLLEKNCDYITSWGMEGEFVRFSAMAVRAQYIAIGFSFDKRMGNDSVTECVREHEDIVAGYTSWNEGRTNIRRRSCDSMIDFTGGLLKIPPHSLFCSWKRPVETKVNHFTFDLADPLYLLVAIGSLATHGVWGNIAMHERIHIHQDPLILHQYFGKSPEQLRLLKLHGVCMIFMWMLLVPLAIYVVRYFKYTTIEIKILERQTFWFGWHIILISGVLFVTGFTTLLLFAFDDHWRYEPELLLSAHSIIGLIMLILMILQMLLAYVFLKHREKLWKIPLNFVHGVFGHSLFFLGYASVHTSRHVRDGLPCDTTYPLFFYMVFVILMQLAMSFIVCYTDFIQGRGTSRVYKVFLLDRPENEEVNEEGVIEDEPGSRARKVLLAIYIPILLGFTLYFSSVTLLSGHYDCITVEKMKPPAVYTVGRMFE